MDEFTPVAALAGGALIGASASLLLWLNGEISGISGIFNRILRPGSGGMAWQAALVGGLVVAGIVAVWLEPATLSPTASRSLVTTLIAGGLVGFGVRMGNGCTSGHGICGLSRLSQRSMVAVVTFMATGILTASLIQLAFGGTP